MRPVHAPPVLLARRPLSRARAPSRRAPSRRHCTRPSAAPASMSGHDRRPHGGVAQRVGEVGGIATRQIDEAGTVNFRGQRWVLGVGPRSHVDHDLLDAEPLGLRLAKSCQRSSDFWPSGAAAVASCTYRGGRPASRHASTSAITGKYSPEPTSAIGAASSGEHPADPVRTVVHLNTSSRQPVADRIGIAPTAFRRARGFEARAATRHTGPLSRSRRPARAVRQCNEQAMIGRRPAAPRRSLAGRVRRRWQARRRRRRSSMPTRPARCRLSRGDRRRDAWCCADLPVLGNLIEAGALTRRY